jgi:sulfide:quinone oxidoreductase
MADYIPPGAKWIRDSVAAFEPENNAVVTKGGERITYDQLVVALGIQLDWGKIKGLEGNMGKDGICSNYSYEHVESTWRFLRDFKGGNAVFTFPSTPIKCAGAPQKIMYLADDALRRSGVRGKSKVIYASATPGIFGIKHYAAALQPIVERKGIETHFKHNLVEVRAASKEAVFQHIETKEELVLPYELLHVVPPQSAPDVVKKSALANAAGWVEVDKYSLQHPRFPNVFSLGDNSSLPTSRTGAAIRKQAPVLVENLLALRTGQALAARYDGYASCPLVTGYGRLILAEFDYDGNPMESFPFDQTKERYSMYAFKAYALPEIYWNGMLRGRA